MEGRMATCEEIEQMKKDEILEMPWIYLDEEDFIYLYEEKNCVCAVIKLSVDPLDNNVIWIDEFEIVRSFRNQGIGKSIICSFIKECDKVIRLLAKNRSVADFWYKCGFQYDNPSWTEIPMVYTQNL